jgi:uncharacterized Zn finger protein
MRRWTPSTFYESRPKRQPPKDGIKSKKVGTTWWGQLWISALERMSEGYSNRLARGRSYARAGRTHDLKIHRGQVSAKVTGSRPRPYVVTLKLASLSDAVWKHAIRAMAQKAHFSAQLLAGNMPQQIEEAFSGSGASLFPTKEADLVTECTCPDFANPCKHVAATHYVLGESLDRDPFLLFELRGRNKEQVLKALRLARAGEARSGEAAGDEHSASSDSELTTPSVTLGELSASRYDRPREELAMLSLCFQEPTSEAAVLRQLGTPSGWKEQASPADLLSPLVRAAAARARHIALGDTESDAAVEANSVRPRNEPDENQRSADAKSKDRKPGAAKGAKARPNPTRSATKPRKTRNPSSKTARPRRP